MDKHTFMLIGGLVISCMGLAYLVSERFALDFFHLRKFGMKSLFELLMSERTGVKLIRFGLGPVLLVVGARLVAIAMATQ